MLEALACGTPVVLPHCGVFDELWIGRIPDAWIYDEGNNAGLLASLTHAGSAASKPYLKKHPVNASWKDATKELLAQYEELIEANLPARQTLSTIIRTLDSLLRATIMTAICVYVMKAYTGRMLKIVYALADDLLDM